MLASSACWTAPVLAPVRTLVATPSAKAGFELSGAAGYAASPGAGLGTAVVPGSPFMEGELRYGFTPSIQLTGGLGLSFLDYFVPWPTSVSIGSKLVLWNDPDFSIAFAPRIDGASTVNLLSQGGTTVFGTRDAELDLPLIVTHRFPNRMMLSLQVWGRGALLRQENTPQTSTTSSNGSGSSGTNTTVAPVEAGQALALGGAVMFSFPRIRGSTVLYHLYLGGEELWLAQTSATNQPGPDPFTSLVSLQRFSLTAGFGVSYPLGD